MKISTTIFTMLFATLMFINSIYAEPYLTIDNEFSSLVKTLDFSKDARHLLVCNKENDIRILDTVTGKIVYSIENTEDFFVGYMSSIRHPFFSPDETKIITAANPFHAIVWDIETKKPIHYLKTAQSENGYYANQPASCGLLFARFSEDGSKILTQDAPGGYTQIWDAETGEELYRWSNNDTFENFVLMNSEYVIIEDTYDKEISVIDAEGKKRERATIPAIHYYDIKTGQVKKRIDGHYFGISKDRTTIAVVNPFDTETWALTPSPVKDLNLYSLQNQELVDSFTLPPKHLNRISDLSPDGNLMLFGGAYVDTLTPTLIGRSLFNIRNKEKLFSKTTEQLQTINHPNSEDDIIQFLPDGKRYATVNDNKIHFWNLNDSINKEN